MPLKIQRSKDSRVIKSILQRIADIPGGVCIHTASLGGSALLESTPLAQGSNGLYEVVKTAKVLDTVAANATSIPVVKGHHFKVNDYIGNGTKAQKITAIDKTTSTTQDTITVTATLGVALAAGDVLVECAGTDEAQKYSAIAVAGSNYDVVASDNLFVDAWTHAVIKTANAVPVSANVKSNLKCVVYV